jgi:predicted CoA-binding protein
MNHAIASIDRRPVTGRPLPADAITAGRLARQILSDAHTIAVVGASTDPASRAHWVPKMLREHGWRVIAVNPVAGELFGHRAYARLADVPERVDLVVVFGPSRAMADVAREAARIGAGALWLQPGLRSAEARRIAETAGMDYIEDTCIGTERAIAGMVHAGHRHARHRRPAEGLSGGG